MLENVFQTSSPLMPPLTPNVCDDMMQLPPPACGAMLPCVEPHAHVGVRGDFHPGDEDDTSAPDDCIDPESPPSTWPSALSSMDLNGLLKDFQGSPLGRMMSDAADQASSLFHHYESCRDLPTGHKSAQNAYNKKTDTAVVNRDVMFPTSTQPQAIFDDYEFCGDLSNGSGAFGRVVIVRRWESEQLRACKIVRVRSAQERELIETEVELLKSLVHPNIVELHGVYLEEVAEQPAFVGKVYMVCEFCSGGDLASRIVHHRDTLKEPMSESQVAYMMQQILSATKFCHDRGIIHRDLKPQNILFQTCSRWSPIKIIDFGLADFVCKIQETAQDVNAAVDNDALCADSNGGDWLAHVPDLCSGGAGWIRKNSVRHVMQIAGTTPYMAPEVFARWYDHRFDNFSIGIILYELLCGSHPFYTPGVDDQQSVKTRIMSTDPEFMAEAWSNISPQAIDLCTGLLEKEPAKRLTATQALEHPWLTDPEKPSAFGNKEEITMSRLKGLVSYPAYDKFKRAVYLMLTKELSEQQTQELRKLFMALDVTGDGVLSPKELMDGMHHVGLDLPDDELAKLVAALSPSGDEQIHYREFISALIQRWVNVDRAQLLECFRKFDAGGTGRIRFEDVQSVLCDSDSGAPGITTSEWAEVVAQGTAAGGVANTAELTFDEFVALLEPSVVQSGSAAAAA